MRCRQLIILCLVGMALIGVTLVRIGAADTPPTEPQQDRLIQPEVATRSEGYAAARRSFHTSLHSRGHAPEPDSMPNTPEGATLLTYPSGRLRLAAWIGRPEHRTPGRLPAVLFLHGGFSLGPHDWPMSKAFRDSGYIVMTPTVRGENRQAGAFSLFYDEVDDVLAAADRLATEPDVDPERIYVAGHSNGGTLALLAALASDRFRGAASFSGSPDQVVFCKYGFEGPVPFDSTSAREYEMRSPLAYAASFHCPVRAYYGSEEPHFYLSTEKMAAIARAGMRDVEAAKIEGGHFSALKEERIRAIAFFRQLEVAAKPH